MSSDLLLACAALSQLSNERRREATFELGARRASRRLFPTVRVVATRVLRKGRER
jgi:hypothetical protein